MNNILSEFKKRRYRSVVVVGNKTPALLSLSLLLQRFAYDVVVANTATQALDRISAARPALVIADMVLAGMGSTDLFEQLRQDKRTASIPVIFMVSPGDAAAETRCLDNASVPGSDRVRDMDREKSAGSRHEKRASEADRHALSRESKAPGLFLTYWYH